MTEEEKEVIEIAQKEIIKTTLYQRSLYTLLEFKKKSNYNYTQVGKELEKHVKTIKAEYELETGKLFEEAGTNLDYGVLQKVLEHLIPKKNHYLIDYFNTEESIRQMKEQKEDILKARSENRKEHEIKINNLITSSVDYIAAVGFLLLEVTIDPTTEDYIQLKENYIKVMLEEDFPFALTSALLEENVEQLNKVEIKRNILKILKDDQNNSEGKESSGGSVKEMSEDLPEKT